MNQLVVKRAVRSKRITQVFGENKACITRNSDIVSATREGTCPANTKPFYKEIGMEGHNGIDIATWTGEMVCHSGMFDGWMKTHVDRSGGIGVDVISDEPIGDSHWLLRYWHLKAPIGYDGRKVKYGQMIGLAGNSGASSGPHLHMGIKKCDKDGNSLEKGNGYYGAVDPEPYYEHDIYAADSAIALNKPPAPLTEEEKDEIRTQIPVITRVILHLREKLARM